MLPPKGTQPIQKEKLSAEFQGILTRLGLTFGASLHLKAIDPEWLEVSVDRLSAPLLHAQLQLKRKALFGAADTRVQVIQQVTPTGTVTYLHMLSEPNWGNPGAEALRSKGKFSPGSVNPGTASAARVIQPAAGGTGYYAATYGKK